MAVTSAIGPPGESGHTLSHWQVPSCIGLRSHWPCLGQRARRGTRVSLSLLRKAMLCVGAPGVAHAWHSRYYGKPRRV